MEINMIKPKKMNAVMLAVRDIEKSLVWYKKHFGFNKLYDVPGGILIGADGVEVVLSQVDEPQKARKADEAKDICIRLFAFEVTPQELQRAEKEFPEDTDLVRINHPKYKSCITGDPDGHSIELYVDKICY
jgi:catechol-2,3-dioxygenase